MTWLAQNPSWRELRSRPRIARLIAELRLQPQQTKSSEGD
jgi:hypothetical protein